MNEPRLDPWLARILITELLWGKETLKTECKPAQTILNYEKQLRDELSRIKDVEALKLSNQRGKRYYFSVPIYAYYFCRNGPFLRKEINNQIESPISDILNRFLYKRITHHPD